MKTAAEKIHDRQRRYIASQPDKAVGFELIAAEAFVESIRKLGYRSAATAADEIIDNAIEAGAENVHVAFGFGEKSDAKPDALAFLDDGYGMVPEMVSAAARWGGGDRINSREMFGRFGFGLPSASVSQGRAFDVFSRIDDDEFHAVTIDVESIGAGKYTRKGRVLMPEAVPAALPQWVVEYAEKHFPGGAAALRTVVVWRKFDVITWKTATTLETNFLQHFGLVYRGFLRTTNIAVNGKRTEPIDPLFTTEGYRFYDLDVDRAEAYPPLDVEVKDDNGNVTGVVRVRFSYMPPTFMSKDKNKEARGKNMNARGSIRRENNGLIFTRHGRQIDVLPRSEIYTALNLHRYIGVEVDFPATLDEEFGITTSKQQVTPSERIVQLLRQHNVHSAINAMYERLGEERDVANVRRSGGADGEPRTSETVMEEVSTILKMKPATEEQQRTAKENLERDVDKIAQETGLDREFVAEQKERETLLRPYKVETERMVDGPFYRAEQKGGQLVLTLNTAHRFFHDLYAPLSGAEGARLRAGLELLLFVLGQCEVESTTDGRIWYQSERVDWSRKLNAVLTKLDEHIDVVSEDADVE